MSTQGRLPSLKASPVEHRMANARGESAPHEHPPRVPPARRVFVHEPISGWCVNAAPAHVDLAAKAPQAGSRRVLSPAVHDDLRTNRSPHLPKPHQDGLVAQCGRASPWESVPALPTAHQRLVHSDCSSQVCGRQPGVLADHAGLSRYRQLANSAEPLKILYFVTHVASIQAEPRQRNSNLGAESPGSTYGPEVVMA